MKSAIGGYLSLVNSHSPKTNESFSFSDTEYGASADNSDEDDNDNTIKVKSKTHDFYFAVEYSFDQGRHVCRVCQFC